MKPAAWLLLFVFALPRPAVAEPFTLTDDFVGYMKTVLNPFDFGRRSDGRFYPYSTRYGRRIGYALPVTDKSLYHRGQSAAEADAELRAQLLATAARLSAALARRVPAVDFTALPRAAQEVLLDHAFTEGVERLPEPLCAAALRGDWRTLIDQHLYVRAPDGWPDHVKNAAFGRRWIYGETGTPLVPLRKQTGSTGN